MKSAALPDVSTRKISSYINSLKFEDLSPAVIRDCKRRLIDTIGCGLGAFNPEPCRIARNLAARCSVENGSRVLVSGNRTLPELAAFANGTMIRYLDGNDTVSGGGGGHPSDVMSGVISAAEFSHIDGKLFITSLIGAYEVFINFFRSARLRDLGWDHVVYTAVGTAAGASKAIGLSQDQTEHAIALAITPNLALEVTRRGELSMWKGCAGPNASRNGLFAAILAAEGMTGPLKAFEGVHGVWDTLGKQCELSEFPIHGESFAMLDVNHKRYLAEFHAQAPIACAIELSSKINVEDIDSLVIYTYWFAWSEIGSEPEKWHPTTRETADHSVPYIVAAVLIDGAFDDSIFDESRLKDPAIHALVEKFEVKEDQEFSREYPRLNPCRIEIKAKSGNKLTAKVDYPIGHARNPMTDAEITKKFIELACRSIPKSQANKIIDAIWKVDQMQDVGNLIDLCILKN